MDEKRMSRRAGNGQLAAASLRCGLGKEKPPDYSGDFL
jgi:hypothetical protein